MGLELGGGLGYIKVAVIHCDHIVLNYGRINLVNTTRKLGVYPLPEEQAMVTTEEKKEFKEALVRRLAEAYEEGKGHAVGLENETQAEREVVTEMKAEGSVMEKLPGTPLKVSDSRRS
jgi:hypothetical protein